MSVLFPFNLPGPTAFYVTLLVLTFAVSQACMHYVVAGSLYVAWATLFPGRASVPRGDQPLGATLRDWLPFLLSAAITAGVAPLLFIQVVYQRHFYTANLLLSWRWMVVVPVLIAAFYLLYLLKSKVMERWPVAVRAALAWGTAGCFVFVGFCWTANALLGINETRWPEIYITGSMPFAPVEIVSRMLIWMGAAFMTLPAIVAWQLRWRQDFFTEVEAAVGTRSLAVMAWGGQLVLIVASWTYLNFLGTPARQVLTDSAVLPHVIAALVGMILQTAWWIVQWRSGRLCRHRLVAVSIGSVSMLLGISFVREALRVSALDMTQLYPRHAAAAQVGGFSVCVVFAVLIFAMIGWCVVIVRRGWQE